MKGGFEGRFSVVALSVATRAPRLSAVERALLAERFEGVELRGVAPQLTDEESAALGGLLALRTLRVRGVPRSADLQALRGQCARSTRRVGTTLEHSRVATSSFSLERLT